MKNGIMKEIKLVYPKVTIMNMVITPEIAKVFMLHNYPKNRKIRQSIVNAYADEMRNNRWNPMASYSDPILFNDKGIMINGQHRTQGCIEAGVPFETRVIFGIPDPDDTLYQLVDNGTPRRTADVIDIPNANSVASIAKVYIALKDGNAPLLSSLQGKMSSEKNKNHNVSKSQIIESIEENTAYFEEIHSLGRKLASPFGRARGTFSDVLTLINFVGRGDKLESFVSEFGSDVPTNATIISCKSYMTKCFCSNNYDTSPKWIVGTILAAYENYRNGTAVGCFNQVQKYLSRYDKYLTEARNNKHD